jgi:hypothetical protein
MRGAGEIRKRIRERRNLSWKWAALDHRVEYSRVEDFLSKT